MKVKILKPSLLAIFITQMGVAYAEGNVNEKTLETIEVKGQRVVNRLGESKTKRQQLDENLVQDVRDMVRYDPAVSVVEGGRGASNGFAIRGVDKDRVAITIDGLSQAESRSSEGFQELFGGYGNFNANRNANELENISEVNIKKGADSLASGSGALGGAVEYKTKSPNDVVNEEHPFYAAAKTGYTSRNQEKMASLDVASYFKNFDARLVYTRRFGQETENHTKSNVVHNTVSERKIASRTIGKLRETPDPQSYRSQSLLFKLGYHFNENNYLLASYDEYRQDRKTDEWSNVVTDNGTNNYDLRKRNDVTYTKRQGLTYENRRETGAWDKLRLGYDKQDIQMTTMTWDIKNLLARGVNTDVYYNLRRIHQNTQQWFAKADKAFDFGETQWLLNYGLGGSIFKNQNDLATYTVYALDPIRPSSKKVDNEFLVEAETKKYHAFINNTVRWGQLRLNAGLRYDDIRAKTLPNDKYLIAMTQDGLHNARARFKAASYALGIDWQWRTGWAIQGKFSTAFRAPTTDEMWFNYPHPDLTVLANKNLRDERAKNFELGMSGSGNWGNFHLSAFHTRYKNFIDFAFQGKKRLKIIDTNSSSQTFGQWISHPTEETPHWQNVNRDAAQISGMEFKGRWNLDSVGLPKGLFSSLTATYQRGKAKQEDGSYSPLNAMQPFGAVLGLGYEQPENRWSLRTQISYTAAKKPKDTSFSYEDPHTPWPYARHGKSYTLVDLIGHYRFNKHATLRAGIFNLFNKEYFTWDSLRSIREFGAVNRVDKCNDPVTLKARHEGCAHNGIQRFTAPGRNFSVNLQVQF